MIITEMETSTTDMVDAVRVGESPDNRVAAVVDERPDGSGHTARQRWQAVASAAGRPVVGESLVVVRCVFGVVAIVTAVRILALGWIDDLWVGPAMHLQWSVLAPPVPPRGAMVAMVVGLGVLGFMIMMGIATRAAAALWVIGFGWIELLDKAAFLNHYWAMLLLVATLLVAVPVRSLLTVGRRGVRTGHARLDVTGWPVRLAPVDPVAMWQVWLLRAQVVVIYGFAGIAKLDPDWLLRGEPMATWLAARTHVPMIGPVLADPTVAIVASWMGLAFDCTIVLWLWWRPTRVPALMAVGAFHLVTWFLFPDIGVFPLLMVGLATVWLPPDWPTRVRLAAVGGQPRPIRRAEAHPWRPVSNWVLIGVVLWIGVQVVVPLRHLAVPGDVRWTEESSRFAWRVMAEDKAGWAVFTVTSMDGSQRVPITDVLEPWQARVAATRPDMVLQVAHELADRTEAATGVRPTVAADVTVAWNGRPGAPLVDSTVDLAAQPRAATHQTWVLPPPP